MNRIVVDREAVRPQLPAYEQITQSAIASAVATWDAARATLSEKRRDTIELEQTREAAEWRDAEAADEARAAGKAEPKRSNVAEHDKKLDAARHEEKVATLSEQRALDELQAALDAHQSEWLEQTTSEIAVLSKAWGAALSTLSQLHAQLATAHRCRGIASNGDVESDGPGTLTSGIRIAPSDVQGLEFAATPQNRAPGAQQRVPKGVVGIDHVLAELAEMAVVPAPEAVTEPLELQRVTILGETRMLPKPISPEQRAERISRAAERHAEREATSEAVVAEVYGGDQ